MALSEAVTERIPSRIVPLTHGKTNTAATGVDDFLHQTDIPKAILYTEKEASSAMYKSLSTQFYGRMILAEARGETLKQKLKVEKAPKLIVVPKGEDVEWVVYDGPLKHANIHEFLSKWALPAEQQQTPDSSTLSPNAEETEPCL